MLNQQAVLWYRRGAEQGSAGAQLLLGNMYLFGQGVAKDDQLAVFWYRKAAEQGHAGTQAVLGSMFAEGRGVLKDDRQAAFWFNKAAEQGDVTGQFELGARFALGQGVPRDDQLAYFWSLLASVEGRADAARNRDFIERRLTAEQRAAAQAAAREWKPVATAPAGPFTAGVMPNDSPPRKSAQYRALRCPNLLEPSPPAPL